MTPNDTTITPNPLQPNGYGGVESDSAERAPYHTHDGVNSPKLAATSSGGGAKSVTFIVGPSSNSDSDTYDYVTDGTNDDIQIQAAIDALPSTGGRIVLREGTYTIDYVSGGSGSINSSKNGVTLQGQGRGTIIKFENGISDDALILTLSGSRCKVIGVYFDGNRANVDGAIQYPFGLVSIGTFGEVFGCFFINAAGIPLTLDTSSVAHHNEFRDCDVSYTNTDYYIYASLDCIIESNLFYTTLVTDCIAMIFGGAIAANNKFSFPDSNVAGVTDGTLKVIGNNIEISNSCDGVIMIDSAEQVINNSFYYGSNANVAGIAIYNCTLVDGNLISGGGQGVTLCDVVCNNFIEGLQATAINIASGNTVVSNNNITNIGQATNNTYSAILLSDSSSDNNTIIGNVIRSTATNKHKYGIREDNSGCDKNIIAGNNVRNAVTANISTQGANTDVSHNITA
jgi:hypothetical protein